jgi:hypothetical protein
MTVADIAGASSYSRMRDVGTKNEQHCQKYQNEIKLKQPAEGSC